MAEQIPDQQGRLRLIVPAIPGVGDEVSITQEARVRWKIASIIATLATSAAGGSRLPELVFAVGGTETIRISGRSSQGPNISRVHLWAGIFSFPFLTGSKAQVEPFPPVVLINNETIITTDTVAIDAADQWSSIAMMVEEWIEPLA